MGAGLRPWRCCSKNPRTVIDLFPRDNVKMRILVVSIFGALLASCSGSSRVEGLLRGNAPPHPAAQYTARKNTLDNRSSPNTRAGTTGQRVPHELPDTTAQSRYEEEPPCAQPWGPGRVGVRSCSTELRRGSM